jgi:hypothetical protein
MGQTSFIVAFGIFTINILVILLDKPEYISILQTIDMVLIPLVGGLMPVSTTINNPTPGQVNPNPAANEPDEP